MIKGADRERARRRQTMAARRADRARHGRRDRLRRAVL